MAWSIRTHKILAGSVKAVMTYLAFWVIILIMAVFGIIGVSALDPEEFKETAKRIYWLGATLAKTAGNQKNFEDFMGHWRLHNGAIPEGAPYAENPSYLKKLPMRVNFKSPFADVYEK